MAKCVNILHPDYLELLRKSNLDSATLSSEIGVWMEENNTDEWPSLEQLGLGEDLQKVIITDQIRKTVDQVDNSSKPIVLLLDPSDGVKYVIDGNQRIHHDLHESYILISFIEDVKKNIKFLKSISNENNVIRKLINNTKTFKKEDYDAISNEIIEEAKEWAIEEKILSFKKQQPLAFKKEELEYPDPNKVNPFGHRANKIYSPTEVSNFAKKLKRWNVKNEIKYKYVPRETGSNSFKLNLIQLTFPKQAKQDPKKPDIDPQLSLFKREFPNDTLGMGNEMNRQALAALKDDQRTLEEALLLADGSQGSLEAIIGYLESNLVSIPPHLRKFLEMAKTALKSKPNVSIPVKSISIGEIPNELFKDDDRLETITAYYNPNDGTIYLVEENIVNGLVTLQAGFTHDPFSVSGRNIFNDPRLKMLKTYNNNIVESLVEAVLHEVTHGWLLEAVRNPQTIRDKRFVKEIKAFLDSYRKQEGADLTQYGFSDKSAPEEFIAELVSNGDFILHLKDLDAKNKTNLVTRIIQFIARLFGGSAYDRNYDKIVDKILNYTTYKIGSGKDFTPNVSSKAVPKVHNIKDVIKKGDPNSTKKAFSLIKDSILFDEDSHTYTDKETKEVYTSVTTRIDNARFGRHPEDEISDAMLRGALIGTTTHSTIESLFGSVSKDVEKDLGFKMTKEAKDQLRKILKEKLPTGKGIQYLSEVVIVDYEGESAGKIDLVVLNANGTIHSIWDFKTKEKGFLYWDKPYIDPKVNTTDPNKPKYRMPYSSRQRAHLQLSSYRRMIQRTLGLWADTLNVLMLQPNVEGDTITSIKADNLYGNKTGVDTWKGESSDTNAIIPPITVHSTGYKRKKSQFDDPHSKKLDEDENFNRVHLDYLKPDGVIDEIFDKLILSLKHKRDVAERGGKHSKVLSADKFLDKLLREENKNIAILEILRQVDKSGNEALKEYSDFKANNAKIPSRVLLKWLELISGYKSIEKYKAYFLVEGAALDEKTKNHINNVLEESLKKMTALTYIFEKEAMENTIDSLEPYFNRLRVSFRMEAQKAYRKMDKATRDKIGVSEAEYVELKVAENDKSLTYRTRETIRTELKRASKDINAFYRYVDNVMDSKDPVIAAAVKSFAVRHERSRVASISKNIDVVNMLRRLEEFQNSGLFTDMADFYSFMIEKEGDKKTGYIVKKYKSQIFQDYNVIVDLTREMDEEKKKGFRKAWKDGLGSFSYADRALYDYIYEFIQKEKKANNAEGWTLSVLNQFTNAGNAPLDYKALSTDFSKYLVELYEKDIITKKELDEIELNESQPPHLKWDIQDLAEKSIISEETADMIIEWFIENTWEYRNPIGKYYNPQWQELSKILNNPNDPRGDFYNMIVKMSHEADSWLPNKSRLRNRLPGVVKQLNERLKEGQSLSTIFQQSIAQELTLRPEDIERGSEQLTDEDGKAKYFLPIHYTVKLEETEQSYDLATIYFRYWAMAKDFHEKSQILPDMELAKWHVDNRETIVTDSLGKQVVKKFKGDKTTSPTISKTSNLANQFDDWFMSIVYGKRNIKGMSFRLFGIDWNVEKVLDKLSNYSAINLLGLNTIQGASNVLLGETMQKIEVIAGEYVSAKSYWEADKYYFSNIMGMLGDWGSRAKKSVASLILEESNVLNDGVGTNMRESNKFRQLANSSTLFVTSYAGEHYMQGRFLFAMMKDVKAKDKDGKVLEGSILDYYQVNKEGKLEISDKVDLEKSKWTENDRVAFNLKVKAILSRIHGAYGDLERVAIQRYALGRMAYQMRKFVLPGFKRRWESYDYVERLEQFTEGNYRTFGRFMSQNMKELAALKFALVKENWNELSPMEKGNVRRTIAEIGFLIASLIVIKALTTALKDVDDEDEIILSLLTYQAMRFKSELLFWSPKIDEALGILRSPMASMSTIENLLDVMSQLYEPFEVYETGPRKGQYKLGKEVVDMIPAIRQIYRIKYAGTQVQWYMK